MNRQTFFVRLLLALTLLILATSGTFAGERPRVLLVNSYHQGFPWSDDIEKGVQKAFHLPYHPGEDFDNPAGKVHLRIFRMDTKRQPAEMAKKAAAKKAREIITSWKPDVVIVSDDNAVKYLLVPFFLNTATPFVFCGVNWNASGYDLPASNVTGMVEVSPLGEIIEELRKYAHGERIGYIGVDDFTNRKTIEYYTKQLNVPLAAGSLVSHFSAWKDEYLRLQDNVDMLIVINSLSTPGWDHAQAKRFILEHTRIPTACPDDPHIRYVLLAKTKIAEEQGWWAGNTALKILAGTPAASIPITTNTQFRLYLNMELAGKLGIKFPMDLIEQATLIEELPETP